MATKKYARAGQPSKKNKIDLKKIIKLCLAGCTNEQIAIAVDVCVATIYNYKRSDKKFLDAIKNNKCLADSIIQGSLWERARGYSHPEEKIFCHDGKIVKTDTIKHYPPDTAAAFIWLKNRKSREWRDKIEVEVKDFVHKSNEGKSLQELMNESTAILRRVAGAAPGN